jgi:pimeloyl-ACP methyl ester carboxylesterase
MLTIYLPGFSVGNREEGNDIVTTLRANDFEVYYESWPHWTDESIAFDSRTEIKKLISVIGEQTELNLIGKSIGTYVAVQLVETLKENIKINQLILLGLPVVDLTDADQKFYRPQVLNRAARTTIIHNEFDPHGSWLQVQELLTGSDYESILKQGVTDHKYNYPVDVLTILQN